MLNRPVIDYAQCKRYLEACERQRKAGMKPKTKVVEVAVLWVISTRPLLLPTRTPKTASRW